uniref:(S)-2-hydroxy-acid oxidase n=1 Tax=Aceria tosichella TaxID=561515 RepID=A0A6G1SFN6_9ACAR
MKFICVDDYEKEAYKRLSKESLGYYASGADEEITLRANVESFKKLKILPRFLRDVASVDMRLEVFGQQINCPIGASPSAMHKLAHPEGELATARGLCRMGSIMTLSTLSTTSLEDVARSSPGLVKWFQLYLFVDRKESLKLIKRAEAAGFKALVLTVDAPKFGTRRRDIKNNFKVAANFVANFDQSSAKGLQSLDYIDASIKWADISWLKSVTKMPVLIKGLMTVEDSLMALEYKADGIVVSNHGGRQLDGVPATIEVLPAIARALNGRLPIFIDGGIRTGSDAFKCLALGATMVFVGRPILWGLACDGAHGVEQVMRLLRDELELTMKLSGCPSLKDISPSMVIHESQLMSKL